MQATQIHKEWLIEFWQPFGGKKCLGLGYKKKLKLNQLKRLAEVEIEYKRSRSREERREQFDKIKRQRHSLNSHKLCFACLGKASVRHHIISLKNGGINCKRNVVSLCMGCHAEIHPWLKPPNDRIVL